MVHSIRNLISTPLLERDLSWLKQALQSAIELEQATLPLYLGAMFSLETQNYTTYNLIRSIVMEEMVHMAIACNMLAVIGGKPQIKNIVVNFPASGLPGGAEPDLETIIAPLSQIQLKNFMRLEAPLFLLPAKFKDEQYPTIANFYQAITETIIKEKQQLIKLIKNPTKEYSNQIGDDIGFTTFDSNSKDPIGMLCAGIDEIIQQGEGSTNKSLHAKDFQGEESHYCKFAEIYYQARYQVPDPLIELTLETEEKYFKGYPIKPATIVNTLAVPKDGYEEILKLDPNGAVVRKNIEAFDQTYSSILLDLDNMWNGPQDKSWPTFGDAVGKMTQLRVLSCFNIMQYKIPENIIKKLNNIYPEEYQILSKYTDLNKEVYYGPRFFNTNNTSNTSNTR